MRTAIILVDVQNDFLPGGPLAVPGGDKVIAPICKLLQRFPRAPVFASKDWHPPETKHFKAQGWLWPAHCVRDTPGAQIHEEVVLELAVHCAHATNTLIWKGLDPEEDGGYSAFTGYTLRDPFRIPAVKVNQLRDELCDLGIETLIVCGLATDYCVKATVLDALKFGFAVMLYTPGCAAVNVNPDDGALALEEMRAAGALFLDGGL